MDTEKQKQVIREILSSFHIGIETISATEGPAATLFEIRPKVGVRISRIKNLTEEIAVGLCSDKVRFTGAIPGHGTVGFEVPNAERKLLDISDMLSILGKCQFSNPFPSNFLQYSNIISASLTFNTSQLDRSELKISHL